MEHSKAALRATREMVGMTQAGMAKALGVEVRSVKRWESADAPQEAPKDAWDLVEGAKRDQDSLIEYTLDVLDRVRGSSGQYPPDYRIVYWTSQEEWDKYHVGPARDWKMENATSRALATILEDVGINVIWLDRPERRD